MVLYGPVYGSVSDPYCDGRLEQIHRSKIDTQAEKHRAALAAEAQATKEARLIYGPYTDRIRIRI